MLQVFLSLDGNKFSGFENEDGFPVSERLLPELKARFSEWKCGDTAAFCCAVTAEQALAVMRDFYDRYALSQPQRRIRSRYEKILAGILPDNEVWFMAADVSEHRSRKYSKKT